MEVVKFHGNLLKKYFIDETFSLQSAEYIIQQVESHDALRGGELQKQGFCFHDRILFVEANLETSAGARNRINSVETGIVLQMSYEYPIDLYELAYESFETDRRFHFEQQFDQCMAKDVKNAYVNQCREQGMPVFSARKEDELLGYIIIDPYPDRGDGCFQIMLGVTRAGIKGKMAVFPLYNGLLNRMALSENGGYTKYCGYISSSNIASINLHHYLGAKVIKVVDEYIYRAGEG